MSDLSDSDSGVSPIGTETRTEIQIQIEAVAETETHSSPAFVLDHLPRPTEYTTR